MVMVPRRVTAKTGDMGAQYDDAAVARREAISAGSSEEMKVFEKTMVACSFLLFKISRLF